MGSSFHHDSPIVSFLSAVGNLMILSCLWCVTILPVVTFIPSCAALYHSSVKVVRGNGTGLLKDYFGSLKTNFKQGWALSLILVAMAFLLYTSLDFGAQMSATGAGFAYFVIGIVITAFALGVAVYIAPVLSRFETSFSGIFRLSLYFSMKNPLITITLILCLAISVLLVWFSSGIMLFLMPGIYTLSVSTMVEKQFVKYLKSAGLFQEDVVVTEKKIDEAPESAIAQAKMLDDRKKDS